MSEKESRHAAALRVSPTLLLSLLGLPADVHILGVRTDYDGTLLLGLEHPSLPEVGREEMIQETSLLLRIVDGRVFASWGFAPEKEWRTSLVHDIAGDAPSQAAQQGS